MEDDDATRMTQGIAGQRAAERSWGNTMRLHAWLLALALASGCASGAGGGDAGPKDPADAGREPAYVLAATHIVTPPPPGATGPHFTGISGLAALREGAEMLAVSDDREDSRVFRIGIEWTTTGAQVKPLGTILLQRGGAAPAVIDAEGIAITRDGHMLISSEGVGNQQPRQPPALIEYGIDGRFLRQLPLRPRYLPNATGPLTTGVRENAGFESLTVTSDFSRLFTATELPLAQDGAVDPFAPGVRTRILEYVAAGDSYRPAREFVYELEALEAVPYERRFAINGLVELLALNNRELLALERGFIESADRAQATNRIRVFRISLEGATDVAGFDSLRDAPGARTVSKTLLIDVNTIPGLDPRLANLDNFEGMAWGPPLTLGGARPLVLVSDDNESPRQVTAFLLFKR